MNVVELITAKRDGRELTSEQIRSLVQGYAKGEIPEYQMSAFAMAVYFQGMNSEETFALTQCMLESGEVIQWPSGKPKVDKHSTGGIGDKVSIALAPILACCGLDVPMISGRGLGPTGGTLDKLESIDGYRCDLSIDEFKNVVNWCGCSITGASQNLAPADRKLYALRDVTGTVPSVPLITSSILSKKLAEGISSLVLDVKWGSGSFMKTREDAKKLATALVATANRFGVKTTALITDMNQPLGKMIGNSVEIDETVDLLEGNGPSDLLQLTKELAIELLIGERVVDTKESAESKVSDAIQSGEAKKRLAEMVKNHGGDLNLERRRADQNPVASYNDGYVCRIDSERLGLAVIELGGGRKEVGQAIDHSVGIEFLIRLGDQIEKGQTIANVFCDDQEKVEYVSNLISLAVGTSPVQVDPVPLVVERIE